MPVVDRLQLGIVRLNHLRIALRAVNGVVWPPNRLRLREFRQHRLDPAGILQGPELQDPVKLIFTLHAPKGGVDGIRLGIVGQRRRLLEQQRVFKEETQLPFAVGLQSKRKQHTEERQHDNLIGRERERERLD